MSGSMQCAKLKEALKLLRSSSAHVYRQQFAGSHKQDKEDASKLLPEIEAFLKQTDEGCCDSCMADCEKGTSCTHRRDE